MKVKRSIIVDTDCFNIGDKIQVDHYTATCQRVILTGSIFLMDQYLDTAYAMNTKDTNTGGYEKSGLRKALKRKEVLDIFKDIRDYMIPLSNGDLVRIPFAEEMFGDRIPEWCEPDHHKQWPLMWSRFNRLASRLDDYEWGWLQNKDKITESKFLGISSNGNIDWYDASNVIGVRLVFKIDPRKLEEK